MTRNPPNKNMRNTNLPLNNGQVTVSITRKHSIRQFETLDVTLSVVADVEPGESQTVATKRLYEQLKKDMLEVSNEVRDLARERSL